MISHEGIERGMNIYINFYYLGLIIIIDKKSFLDSPILARKGNKIFIL